MSDLSLFLAGDEVDLKANSSQEEGIDGVSQAAQTADLRANSSQEKRTDGVTQAIQTGQVEPVVVLVDPITRARAKRLNETLQAIIQVVQESIGVPSLVQEGNSSFVNCLNIVGEEVP